MHLPRKRRPSLSLAIGTLFLFGALALGCGGHHRHRTALAIGNARLLVDWPAGRGATNNFGANVHNLTVSIKRDSTILASQILVKPQAEQPFSGLPAGDYSMEILARETTDGSGPIIGGTAFPITIIPSQTVDIRFSLTALVDRIVISPTQLTLKTLQKGNFTLSVYGSDGEVVLGDARALIITSSDPTIATAALPGIVTAGAIAGIATITLHDPSVGKTAQLKVVVLPSLGVSLLPTSVTLSRGESRRFVPTVVGLSNPTVVWSVREGRAGGTVNANGLYTAPQTLGVYHVVATSAQNHAFAAIATVTVGAGSVGVGVQ